jgi:hypothetical protein
MSAHWRTDEVTLRRNLLFRLLSGFDFDNPVFQHEPISTPIADRPRSDESDTFIFAFQS